MATALNHNAQLRSSLRLLSEATAIKLNLETAVGREKDVHALDLYEKLDVHGEFEKLVVTLLVMRAFSTSRRKACAYFRDPTAVSRFNHWPEECNITE